MAQESSKSEFWLNFRWILDRFWKDFDKTLVGFLDRFLKTFDMVLQSQEVHEAHGGLFGEATR